MTPAPPLATGRWKWNRPTNRPAIRRSPPTRSNPILPRPAAAGTSRLSRYQQLILLTVFFMVVGLGFLAGATALALETRTFIAGVGTLALLAVRKNYGTG